MNDFRDYIAHHGIKGQKWGVRNGPPYPLDASDHNARERKANWKSSLSKGNDVKKKKPVHKAVETSRRRSKKTVGGNGELHYTEHDTSKTPYQKEFKYEPKTDNSSTALITNQKVGSLVTPDNVKAGMSDETKDALFTLSVEALATSAVVATMVGLGKLQANTETDRDFLNYKNTAKAKTLDELPKTKGNTTTDDHVKDNNPGYPSKGRTMNCVLCTTSMALREKGYDVAARTSPDGWNAKRVLNKMFTNVKNHNVRSSNSSKGIQKAENLIKGFGNGAYGNICVYWPQGGGHSMFFKNDGGTVKIYDGQSGKTYSLKDFDQKILGSMYIARLDTAIPTQNATAFVDPRSK